MPLHTSTSKLLKLRDLILSVVEGSGRTTLSEVENKMRELLPFFLGGVKEDGEYKENSLARLIKLTLGFYIDPRMWITLEKQEGIRAFDYITIEVVNTKFLDFITKLNNTSQLILKLAGIAYDETQELEVKTIIQKPERILEVLKDIYVSCLRVNASHNYYMFFILSIEKMPRKLMETAYPKLRHNFNEFISFLGMEKYFEPKVEKKELREAYTVWIYSKKGLGKALYELNEVIWNYFNDEKIEKIWEFISEKIPNPKENFKEVIIEALGKDYSKRLKLLPQYKLPSSYGEEGCKICDEKERDGYMYCYGFIYSLDIKSMVIRDVSHSIRYISGSYSSRSHPLNISIPNFFNDIFPLLFTKLLDYKIENNQISVEWRN